MPLKSKAVGKARRSSLFAKSPRTEFRGFFVFSGTSSEIDALVKIG
jgi:hypothetical protein